MKNCETCAHRTTMGDTTTCLKNQAPETCHWHTMRVVPLGVKR